MTEDRRHWQRWALDLAFLVALAWLAYGLHELRSDLNELIDAVLTIAREVYQ